VKPMLQLLKDALYTIANNRFIHWLTPCLVVVDNLRISVKMYALNIH